MTLNKIKKEEDFTDSEEDESYNSNFSSENSYEEDSFVTKNDDSEGSFNGSENSGRKKSKVKKEHFVVKDKQEDMYLITQMQEQEKEQVKRKLRKIELP